MIGRKAERVLSRAASYAVENDQEYFTLETILLSLLEEQYIQETVRACGGNPYELKKDLITYLDKEVPKIQQATGSGGADRGNGEHPIATLGIQRLIQRALFHVQSAGKDEIQPQDLLTALFQSKDSYALYALGKQSVERLDVLNYISHGIVKGRDEESSSSDASKEQGFEESDSSSEGSGAKSSSDPLSNYALNLNDRARAGKIDPLIGRGPELERVIQTLCRRRKNNPLLVGEPGVGKTALAEGLALRIINGEIPDVLKDSVVYALDLGSLLAGAKFRGDFEQRMKRVLNALLKQKEKGRPPILFIDEIHTLIGAGSVSGGVLDAAHLLKPILTRGDLQCMGSTTYHEFRTVFEKDHALARRFQKVDIVEPSVEESVQILNGLKPRFEEHHHVRYTGDAIRAAVELAAKHLTDRFLPDKAIDVMDEVGAKTRLARHSRDPESEEITTIDVPDVEAVIAQIARIPPRSVTTSQKQRLQNLERDLKLTIFGQHHAIEALVTSIRLARSGLRSGDKPVGSFLFCGPTGVGKTELTKQLAMCLGIQFLRFDMSEYMEKHTVSRLIGAPPGYVGFEQAGLLTDAVTKNPHSVILLDEIEKAHPDVWNILLQVMDHGTLTDNNGKKADFRNTIIVMTSNVGSRDIERRSLGLGPSDTSGTKAQKAVEQAFSPEFRNRLDSIVYFNPLDPLTVGQVVGKQLLELESQLLAKEVELEIDPEVRQWLAEKGYDRLMGARPMGRLIQDKLKKPLAEEILFGKLENGGHVHVSLKDGEIVFDYRSRGPAEAAVSQTDEGRGGGSRRDASGNRSSK